MLVRRSHCLEHLGGRLVLQLIILAIFLYSWPTIMVSLLFSRCRWGPDLCATRGHFLCAKNRRGIATLIAIIMALENHIVLVRCRRLNLCDWLALGHFISSLDKSFSLQIDYLRWWLNPVIGISCKIWPQILVLVGRQIQRVTSEFNRLTGTLAIHLLCQIL